MAMSSHGPGIGPGAERLRAARVSRPAADKPPNGLARRDRRSARRGGTARQLAATGIRKISTQFSCSCSNSTQVEMTISFWPRAAEAKNP